MKKFIIIVIFLAAGGFALFRLCGLPGNSSDPKATAPQSTAPQPEIPKIERQLALEAKSALLVDMESGKALYEKNAGDKKYPASTTKIMTALLVLENMDLKKKITVGEEAGLVKAGSSVAGLNYGEEITVEELLYGLLLPSGNDAAYVLAVNAARCIRDDADMPEKDALAFFAERMNARARDLGAKHTHFESPDGTHSDGHYTTARDLALIANAAMKNAVFRKIVATPSYEIEDRHRANATEPPYRNWVNTNCLIQEGAQSYPYATGVKTGHTARSGYCLVASAEKEGRGVLAVLLDSTENGVYADAVSLFNAALNE
jgi:D-alanyl-D-alanine carboxypeptidase (penicillin-binding protein 5/6)